MGVVRPTCTRCDLAYISQECCAQHHKQGLIILNDVGLNQAPNTNIYTIYVPLSNLNYS